jgi:16S rRNA (cytosine967-C5)-methyltransferase
MNTRAIATQIVIRVRDEGAYSNVLLPHATADLSGPDRAFVYNLVTGTLRRLRLVDAIIEQASSRHPDELDPEVRSVLEVAIAELLTDTEGATYATVNESVEAVKQLGSPRAASFVNGVLRRLVRDDIAQADQDFAHSLSVPDWLLTAAEADHGVEEAAALLAGLRQASPKIAVRVRPGAEVPSGGVAVEGIAGAFHLPRIPQPDDGLVINDAASTAVGLAVDARSGQRVLDMAAAPGGKTLHLWDQVGPEGMVVAIDSHSRRLRSARDRLDRLGVYPAWVEADGVRTPFATDSFDRVLLDAPCTGVGTLRRRPEIAMRLKSNAARKMAAQQQAMLEEAWRVTKPGGRVIYSVCTVFAVETVDIVAAYPARPPANLPGREWGSGLLLAPHLTGTDGMFIAVIEK